ncbi:MAG TPA: hypothetical protein VGV09_18180 [Steroidobacteraceae bacterium]|nr:hypothetical protein [Steroidobacteraceae bacterium]
MRELKICFILAGTALLVACTTEAPAPPTVPSHPTTVVIAPTENVKLPDGYFKATVNGEERYCRNDLDTGTRVARTKVCLTAAQLKAIQDGSQDFMNQVQNHMGIGATTTGAPQGMGH